MGLYYTTVFKYEGSNMKLSRIQIIVLLFLSTRISAQIEPIRVACIGNSITFGSRIKNPELDSYPSQLGMILGDGFNVINFGISGRTMLKKGDHPYWIEPELQQALDYKPDIIVILLGTNDTKPFNWIYKDEFIPDYISMIDTFLTIESEPVIYACYPPPSFNPASGIRDSIVTTDMIPMIDQIVDSVGVSLIDFHSSLTDKQFLFPDDIHPSVEGSWEMAKIVADSIAGVTVDTMNDVNTAKGQPVTASGFDESDPPQNLNDGDRLTKWTAEGFGCWAVVDIGDLEEIDMFQVDFNKVSNKGFQYTIEASTDSIKWTTVVDQSAREDTVIQIVADKIDPITARFVKLTINGASNSRDDKISVSEFRILKSASFHAPVLFWSAFIISYYLDVIPTSDAGEMVKIYKKVNDDNFNSMEGFREANVQQLTTGITKRYSHQYYTATYKDNKIMISDTLFLDFGILTSINPDLIWQKPNTFELLNNYPNPFNPKTTISFSINKAAKASVRIFDTLGKKIRILGDQYYLPGKYSISWDGKDLHGNTVASGVYYYQLNYGNSRSTANQMIFIK